MFAVLYNYKNSVHLWHVWETDRWNSIEEAEEWISNRSSINDVVQEWIVAKLPHST